MTYPDTLTPDFSERELAQGVVQAIASRWSPRAFRKAKIQDQDVQTLFEAARWAPSCFNAQPWQFHVSSEQTFDDYLALLMEGNQQWAKNASLICFVVVKKSFEHNGSPNPYAEFDAGAAWMALALQARSMGLYTHAMGGVHHQQAAQYLGLDDDHKVVCGIVIGVADTPETLPAELAAREKPSGRKPLAQILKR